MKVLWICFVWPEPTSSAAGVRTLQLISALHSKGADLRIVSPCQRNQFQDQLEAKGFVTENISPNDSKFNDYIISFNPEVVLFDRFMIEEQFSWRVRECCPDALRVLDTIDLHSLRRTRQSDMAHEVAPLALTDSDLQTEDTSRELASIYRSDLSLIISTAELEILRIRYQVQPEMLSYCPIWYENKDYNRSFSSRLNFVAIGNFNHPPNIDSFHLLQQSLWPKVKERLNKCGINNSELHIYGAYPTNEFLSLDNPKSAFRVKGWTPDVHQTLSHYRVNLAPLRFGAGLKGNIADGWSVGTPAVATTIAAEGMTGGMPFGGFISDEWDKFAEDAAELYTDQTTWEDASAKSHSIIKSFFSEEVHSINFTSQIKSALDNIAQKRSKNSIGAMLWYHQLRCTEFFSRWIECKNQNQLRR